MTHEELIKEAAALYTRICVDGHCQQFDEMFRLRVLLLAVPAVIDATVKARDDADAVNVTLQQRIETLEVENRWLVQHKRDRAQEVESLRGELDDEQASHRDTCDMLARELAAHAVTRGQCASYLEQAKAIAADHEATKARLDALRTRALVACEWIEAAEDPRDMLDAARALAKDIKEKYT